MTALMVGRRNPRQGLINGRYCGLFGQAASASKGLGRNNGYGGAHETCSLTGGVGDDLARCLSNSS